MKYTKISFIYQASLFSKNNKLRKDILTFLDRSIPRGNLCKENLRKTSSHDVCLAEPMNMFYR